MPSVFGLPHLSEDAVAAFADGVLTGGAAARAARHCEECPECADAVRGQREAAFLLRSAMAPSLPSGLLDRLAGVPMSTELPPPSSGLPTGLGSDGYPVLIAYRPPQPGFDPDQLAEESAAEGGESGRHGWQISRRAALPIGLIASAAAVVAAGTLGAQVQNISGPNTTANLSGVVSQPQDGSANQSQQPSGAGSQVRPTTGTRRTSPVGYAPQGFVAAQGFVPSAQAVSTAQRGFGSSRVGPVSGDRAGRVIAEP